MEPPRAPIICQHIAGTATAQLWWVSPHGSDWVSLYELRLQEPSGTRSQWFCAQAPERLQNLSPGTQYRIRVRALNAAGPGPWSPPYTFATVPGAKEAVSVMVTVRRRLNPRKKTVYLPGP
ncbi:fibronectin type III domain-containing protein 8-like [Pelodiscus sinensis]|uniref:fibronectin type III domain-containing protein 8-like n=1 Tax=Pelodiscus sinensis TaxID=13735 RepID=UPI003F6AEEA6